MNEARKDYGLSLFVAFFTAALFFVAAGSILYFKLFNDMDRDRREYGIIQKVGATEKEIEKMVSKEIGISLFIPFLFAALHGLFAMKMLSNLLMGSVVRNGIVVSLGYLIFQILYFSILRKIYLSILKEK